MKSQKKNNQFLDEVLEIARKEWIGEVERNGRVFTFHTDQLGGKGGVKFEILQVYYNSARHRIFETPNDTWLKIETQLKKEVVEYAKSLVFEMR